MQIHVFKEIVKINLIILKTTHLVEAMAHTGPWIPEVGG
jgi:hypothetical protein